MVATPTVSAADGEVVVPVRISDDGSAAQQWLADNSDVVCGAFA